MAYSPATIPVIQVPCQNNSSWGPITSALRRPHFTRLLSPWTVLHGGHGMLLHHCGIRFQFASGEAQQADGCGKGVVG